MLIPTARSALLVVSALAALVSMTAAGGLALVAQFAPPASAGEAPDTAAASPDADTFTMMLDHRRVQPILGKEVRASNGEQMGRIVNVIVDGSGRPRAAIIDFGGFLGVGSRKIVVDWNALQFESDSGPISLALTRDQVKAAPEYRDGKPVVVIGATSPSVAPE
jgi:sporulation protein YlmC with PRC-barrel domain